MARQTVMAGPVLIDLSKEQPPVEETGEVIKVPEVEEPSLTDK